MELGPLADGVGVVRIGAGVRKNPAVGGDLEIRGLLDGGQDQHRALVDHVVGVHQLGVGPADHPVVRTGLPDLLGRHGVAAPGMAVARRHGTELRPQLADPSAMVVAALPRGDPQRLFEHRVHERRAVQIDPELGVAGHGHTLVGAGSLGHRFVLTRPVRLDPASPQPTAGAPGLGAGDQDRLGPSVLQVQTGLVHQRLRDVATHTGVARRRLVGPDPLRQQQTRIPVVPRQQIDDPHRVDRLQDPRIGGVAGRRHHQIDGFDVGIVLPPVDLAIADEDRSAWVEGAGDGHDSNLADANTTASAVCFAWRWLASMNSGTRIAGAIHRHRPPWRP